MKIHFYNKGSIDNVSGGYIYNKCVINELIGLGHEVVYDNQIENISLTKMNIVDSLIVNECISFLSNKNINLALLHQVDYNQKSYPFSHAIATSEVAKTEIIGYSDLKEENISVIQPGIEEGWKQKNSHNGSVSNLLSVSNYIERKGLDILVNACYNLKHLNWTLTIVGDQQLDNDCFKSLKKQVSLLGLSDRIKLLPSKTRAEINSLMLESDLLIQPARHETYGMAVYEGIITSLPVLMFKTGAWEEFNRSGLVTVIDSIGIESLTKNLDDVLSTPSKMKIDTNIPLRSWNNVAKDFENLLANINSVIKAKYNFQSKWN